MTLNSPFGNIFQAIVRRVQLQLPEIEYVDQDMGQLDGTSSLAEPVLPCVLIDFKEFTFDDLGSDVQMVQGNITVKLAYAQTIFDGLEPVSYASEAEDYYETEWSLNKALHGWSPGDAFGVMSRRTVESLNTTNETRVRVLTYRIEFEDYSARFVAENTEIMHPGLEFKGELD